MQQPQDRPDHIGHRGGAVLRAGPVQQVGGVVASTDTKELGVVDTGAVKETGSPTRSIVGGRADVEVQRG